MFRKFWVALALTIPTLILAMGKMVPRFPIEAWIPSRASKWIELALIEEIEVGDRLRVRPGDEFQLRFGDLQRVAAAHNKVAQLGSRLTMPI